jgi:hypothetical protein
MVQNREREVPTVNFGSVTNCSCMFRGTRYEKAPTTVARGLRHELSSLAGIVGSKPTRGIDVCVRLIFVCVAMCIGSGLATG